MDSKLHTEMSVSGEIKNLISASKSSQSVAYRLNIQTNICHTNENVQERLWIIVLPPVERVLCKNIMAVDRIGYESFAKTHALVSLIGGNHDRGRGRCAGILIQ